MCFVFHERRNIHILIDTTTGGPAALYTKLVSLSMTELCTTSVTQVIRAHNLRALSALEKEARLPYTCLLSDLCTLGTGSGAHAH